MLNKSRLYWILQIGGWTLYAVVQIVVAISSSEAISTKESSYGLRIIFCFAYAWLPHLHEQQPLVKSEHAPAFAPVSFGHYCDGGCHVLLRIPLSVPLGLFNKSLVFDLNNILGLSLVYSFSSSRGLLFTLRTIISSGIINRLSWKLR